MIPTPFFFWACMVGQLLEIAFLRALVNLVLAVPTRATVAPGVFVAGRTEVEALVNAFLFAFSRLGDTSILDVGLQAAHL